MERGSGYETLFSDDQMIFVSSIEELAARLIELKDSPRRRREIAKAGRMRYHNLFNETVIARYIEEVAFERLSLGTYEWPALVQSSAT
jgi:glycosyltransferase involved in cell wall biosynthesis